ncbi:MULTISPECIES: hypothetical protein [unclassified Sinorhizobium]|uniref:hypothetical protein n=1 Tax=unclassified Sinorhizobium TaxID=2613772 RepID=UPI003526864E
MALVTRETSGLEMRVDGKGRLRLFHMGNALPTSSIVVEGGLPHRRGVVTIEILSQLMTFTTDEADA